MAATTHERSLSETPVHSPRPTGRGRSNKPALLTRVNLQDRAHWVREASEAGTFTALEPAGSA